MNVVIIGEACYDEFIYCKVDRICPEAPVPVLNPTAEISNAGMSQNTAIILDQCLKNLESMLFNKMK